MPAFEKPGFETTRWSEVRRAADLCGTASESLEQLCRAYWYPLYAYLRRSGHNADQAQDFVQSFFVDLLSRKSLQAADPSRGRFRCFLLTACRNHVANLQRAARADRRGGGRRTLALDTADGERRYVTEPVEKWTAEKLYERRWAMAVIDTAFARVREEYAAKGRAERFDALGPLVAPAGTPPTHAEVAEQLQCSIGSVKVAVHRLRQQFGAALRNEIASTLDVDCTRFSGESSAGESSADESVADELQVLLRALRGE